MKKLLVLAIIAILLFGLSACKKQPELKCIDDGHTSQNSLSWDGVYTGVIPAADAEGIEVQITLNTNHKYTMTYKYIGKSNKTFNHSGTFVWSKDGGSITLDTNEVPNKYKVGENTLYQLDQQGKVVTGKLADKYILHKVQ